MVSVPLTDTINMLLTDTTNAFCSSVAIKLGIGIDRMSNQRKAEFVKDNFGIQSFWEVMEKFH
jgi:hypothetical protein